jgi:uncharacterized protein YcbK (DUF882 family)
MRLEQITSNFSRSEFACDGIGCCNNSAPIAVLLVFLLQAIRSYIENPIIVTSGFRCRKHNAKTPNAHPESYHTLGMAADITCPRVHLDDLYRACEIVCEIEGYGYLIKYDDRGIIHVDIRDYYS